MAARIASAERIARSASLPCAIGAPKTAMTLSPICLSTWPPCVRDDAIDAGEEASEQPMHILGVKLVAERRIACEVGEQHCHLPALALRIRERRAEARRGLRRLLPRGAQAAIALSIFLR